MIDRQFSALRNIIIKLLNLRRVVLQISNSSSRLWLDFDANNKKSGNWCALLSTLS